MKKIFSMSMILAMMVSGQALAGVSVGTLPPGSAQPTNKPLQPARSAPGTRLSTGEKIPRAEGVVSNPGGSNGGASVAAVPPVHIPEKLRPLFAEIDQAKDRIAAWKTKYASNKKVVFWVDHALSSLERKKAYALNAAPSSMEKMSFEQLRNEWKQEAVQSEAVLAVIAQTAADKDMIKIRKQIAQVVSPLLERN